MKWKRITTILMALIISVTALGLANAYDFDPGRDINLRSIYDLKNVVDGNFTGNLTVGGNLTIQNKLNVLGDGNFTGDLMIGDNQTFNFFNNYKLRTDSVNVGSGVLIMGDILTGGDLGFPAGANIYANIAEDGSGNWEPYLAMSSTGITTLKNTAQGNVGNKRFDIKMTDGVRIYYGNLSVESGGLIVSGDGNFTGNLISQGFEIIDADYPWLRFNDVLRGNDEAQFYYDVNNAYGYSGPFLFQDNYGLARGLIVSYEGGTPSLIVDSQLLRVGIGTTNPQNTLNVLGDGNFTGDLYASDYLSLSSPISESGIEFINSDTTVAWYFSSVQDGTFRITHDSVGNIMTLQNGTANVGIGTTTPNYKLQVVGNFTATNYYSGDGTQGMTGSCGSGTTLTVKDGLITACS